MQHLDKGDKATASILQPKKVRKGAPGLNASEWSEKQADEDGLKSTRHLIRALDEDDGAPPTASHLVQRDPSPATGRRRYIED